MVYGFARQSGGTVRIYSELGRGTTMCLYLPRHLGALDEGEAEELPVAAEQGHGETVLVVDDEPVVRMLIRDVLIENGYVALEAADGPAALRLLESNVRIDLLITDVGLPGGMNGRQVADAARVFRPALKVLFITGYAENALVGNGHLAPGMEVLTKPFVVATLGNRIREMLERVQPAQLAPGRFASASNNELGTHPLQHSGGDAGQAHNLHVASRPQDVGEDILGNGNPPA
jgi:CheY-like chemotaxis protein